MKLKTFEGYIDKKIKSLKKIKEIVDFIEKYELKYFVVAMDMEDDGYMFEDIRKDNGVYKLEFYDYNVTLHYSKVQARLVDLLNLSDVVVDSLYKCCKEYQRFTIEFHLETGIDSVESFINILKKHKKEIEFTSWMFGMMLENEHDISDYKFQDVLFKTHPEAYKPFIDEIFDGLKRSDDGKGYGLTIHPKIKTKYKGLLGDYYHQKEVEHESGKYNM